MPDVRPETAPKQNLVVVRAGENSLHPGWLNHDNNPYNFDLLVSYFSQAAYENHKNAPGVRAVLVRGGKWDGLFKTLSGLANLDQYDFVWLPDDDIATDGATIETMFALAAEFELGVCQPALSHDSFYSHFIFNQCRAFKLRYVNYVEIMVPCLSRRVLRHALPLFENSMSGFGLDNIWCRWPESGTFGSAILDDIAVHHTRPIGSQLKGAMSDTGLDAHGEENILKSRYGLNETAVPLAFAGIDAFGDTVTGRGRMAWKMLRSWRADFSSFSDPKRARSKLLQILRRQCVKPLHMSILNEPSD